MREENIFIIGGLLLIIFSISFIVVLANQDTRTINGPCYDRSYNKINEVTCEVDQTSIFGTYIDSEQIMIPIFIMMLTMILGVLMLVVGILEFALGRKSDE